jgi:hypothetical protein
LDLLLRRGAGHNDRRRCRRESQSVNSVHEPDLLRN